MPRAYADEIIGGIVDLGCVEVCRGDELNIEPDLAELVKTEDYPLKNIGANKEYITLLGTLSTVTLIGWLSSRYEAALTNLLAGSLCSWDMQFPTPEELEAAPDVSGSHHFFGIRRKSKFNMDRRALDPLIGVSAYNDYDTIDDDPIV